MNNFIVEKKNNLFLVKLPYLQLKYGDRDSAKLQLRVLFVLNQPALTENNKNDVFVWFFLLLVHIQNKKKIKYVNYLNRHMTWKKDICENKKEKSILY